VQRERAAEGGEALAIGGLEQPMVVARDDDIDAGACARACVDLVAAVAEKGLSPRVCTVDAPSPASLHSKTLVGA
jgi:hypothetical protein